MTWIQYPTWGDHLTETSHQIEPTDVTKTLCGRKLYPWQEDLQVIADPRKARRCKMCVKVIDARHRAQTGSAS